MAANTAKVSVSMRMDALRLAKTASAHTGVSFSSLVTAAVERGLPDVLEEIERLRAAEEWIAEMPRSHAPSPARVRDILALLYRAKPPTQAEIAAAFPRATDRVRARANSKVGRRGWRKGSRSTRER
jgi:hypothetical protein